MVSRHQRNDHNRRGSLRIYANQTAHLLHLLHLMHDSIVDSVLIVNSVLNVNVLGTFNLEGPSA